MLMKNMPHDYIERCPYCKEYLLANQVSKHKCNTPINSVKEIPVLFFYEGKTSKGVSLIVAMGFDGVLYRLIKCKNPLTYSASDGFSQRKPSDEDFTKPLGSDSVLAEVVGA
jgi:hypothetical protein